MCTKGENLGGHLGILPTMWEKTALRTVEPLVMGEKWERKLNR